MLLSPHVRISRKDSISMCAHQSLTKRMALHDYPVCPPVARDVEPLAESLDTITKYGRSPPKCVRDNANDGQDVLGQSSPELALPRSHPRSLAKNSY